jgi:cytochrome c-type biogenesis protein CcmH
MSDVFWLYAAGLCAIAMVAIVWPILWRRSQRQGDRTDFNVLLYEDRLGELAVSRDNGEITESEFHQLETELQVNLLSDAGSEAPVATGSSRLPWLAAALVVVLAILIYSDVGFSFGYLTDLRLAQDFRQTTPHDRVELERTVQRLAERLKDQPDNDQGWFLLAQSWRSISAYGKAADAFRHLVDRYPDDGTLASHHAESLFLAENRRFTEAVRAAIDRALSLDPQNLVTLELAAMSAYQAGAVQDAAALFRRALATGVDGPREELLREALARVQGEAGANPSQPEDSGSEDVGREVQVLVEAASGVQAQPGDSVFVYARAFDGPPMPLAVQRMTFAELPRLVQLTSAQAMMAGMSLNDFDQIQLVARISKRGIANASPEDFEAVSGRIDLTTEQPVISLRISQRRGQ